MCFFNAIFGPLLKENIKANKAQLSVLVALEPAPPLNVGDSGDLIEPSDWSMWEIYIRGRMQALLSPTSPPSP